MRITTKETYNKKEDMDKKTYSTKKEMSKNKHIKNIFETDKERMNTPVMRQ